MAKINNQHRLNFRHPNRINAQNGLLVLQSMAWATITASIYQKPLFTFSGGYMPNREVYAPK